MCLFRIHEPFTMSADPEHFPQLIGHLVHAFLFSGDGGIYEGVFIIRVRQLGGHPI